MNITRTDTGLLSATPALDARNVLRVLMICLRSRQLQGAGLLNATGARADMRAHHVAQQHLQLQCSA